VAWTEGNKTEAELRFGMQVNTWGVNDLADAVAGVSAAEIDALVADYDDQYTVAPELRPGGKRRGKRSATARLSSWAARRREPHGGLHLRGPGGGLLTVGAPGGTQRSVDLPTCGSSAGM
jgi:L-arabinose isomerase